MRTRTAGSPPVRTLLVDDEPLALASLQLGLEGHSEVEIIGQAGDGRRAVQLIRSLQPDLIFLDVQMPDMDGFAVLRELDDIEPPEVVFVTAFDQHALKAFDVHALDYLLKPFDDERFDECVMRAVSHVRSRQQGELRHSLQALLRQIAPETEYGGHGSGRFAERITVRGQEGLSFIAARDIDWLESTGNYVCVHSAGGRYLIRSTLRGFLERLDPRRFVRIHRSTAVNVYRIRAVQPWASGDYMAILQDGNKLKVSRNYKDDLLRPFS